MVQVRGSDSRLNSKEMVDMEILEDKLKSLDRKYETQTGKKVVKIVVGETSFLDWKKKIPPEADTWEYVRVQYDMRGEYRNLMKIEEIKAPTETTQSTLGDEQKSTPAHGPMSSSTKYLALKCAVELMQNEQLLAKDDWVKRTLDTAESFEHWLKEERE